MITRLIFHTWPPDAEGICESISAIKGERGRLPFQNAEPALTIEYHDLLVTVAVHIGREKGIARGNVPGSAGPPMTILNVFERHRPSLDAVRSSQIPLEHAIQAI